MRRLLLLVLLLAGCGQGGVEVVRDIPYGNHPRQRLDLYLPAQRDAATPAVVYFHGGGWQGGSKEGDAFVGRTLAAAGIAVAVAGYRLYPEVVFPAFLEDGAAAVARARTALGNPRRLVVMGHSAGAWIAVMLALDRAHAVPIDGAIGLAGPYAAIPLAPELRRAMFGPDETIGDALPITFARAGAPPVLALIGTRDDVVDPASAERLASRIRAAGGTATARSYFPLGHVGVLNALDYPWRLVTGVREDVLRFIGG